VKHEPVGHSPTSGSLVTNLENDLSDMVARFHPLVGLIRLGEREGPVNHGP
jgi:hypothetical protein